jgi:hypothetical protein
MLVPLGGAVPQSSGGPVVSLCTTLVRLSPLIVPTVTSYLSRGVEALTQNSFLFSAQRE